MVDIQYWSIASHYGRKSLVGKVQEKTKNYITENKQFQKRKMVENKTQNENTVIVILLHIFIILKKSKK